MAPGPNRPEALDWLERLPGEVFHSARELIRNHSESPAQASALEAIIAPLRPPETPGGAQLKLFALPSLVYAAMGGDGERALPLSVASALLGRGADVLDDLADDDSPKDWADHTPAEMMLAALELCCALAPLALAQLDAPTPTLLAMSRTLARGMLRASAGQRADVASAGSPRLSTDAALRCAEAKSGNILATLSVLAAELADASPATLEDCAAFGMSLGTAVSIREDYDDLLADGVSRDLRAGTRSYPIALYFELLPGSDRGQFLDLLDRARSDRTAQTEVRQRLRAAQILWHGAITIARYCEHSRQYLARFRTQGPAGDMLLSLVNAIQLAGMSGGRWAQTS
jgi:geranylgeranyl pyrophosphate synthase